MPETLTVAELNQRVRTTIERSLPLVWVSGEVSNLVRAASGHIYFTLKDPGAQVRCVMFRSRAQLVPWRLENGQQVEAQALATLYEPRGDFQLNVEAVRRGGLGRLYEAFLRLKEKLAAEGLFDAPRKRVLPRHPSRVGIVTSPQAAALRDICAAFARRAPHVELIVYPALVQGESAPASLVAAIEAAARRRECDVLLVARGGGSLEDLWAFNDEAVARALAACPVPTVTGVGHETDTTIADFVADQRAATPTAAAELASAGWFAARRELVLLGDALHDILQGRLQALMQRLDLLGHRLVHPADRLGRLRQRIAHLATRLSAAARSGLRQHAARMERTERRLLRLRPDTAGSHRRLERLAERLRHVGANDMARRRAALARLEASLAALNPEATLARGFAIVRDAGGRIVRGGSELARGDVIDVRFARGSATAIVKDKVPD